MRIAAIASCVSLLGVNWSSADTASAGFTNLLAATEAAGESEDAFSALAEQVLRGEASRRAVGPMATTRYYNSGESNVRMRSPEEFLVRSATPSQCAVQSHGLAERRSTVTRTERPGLIIWVSATELGCRNARPPSVTACAVSGDRAWLFDNQVYDCRGGPGFGPNLETFLATLAIAPERP